MMFLFPEAFLLLVPLTWVWWRFADRGIYRAFLLVSGVFVLAIPVLVSETRGADVIVLVDRSLSMPADSEATSIEVIRLLEKDRGPEDRVGIVTFGAAAVVERKPDHRARFNVFERSLDREASDLDAGLRMSLDLIPKGRPARILVFSDGDYAGPDPLPTADLARSRGIPLDYRHFARPGVGDVAVDRIDLPRGLRVGEAFHLTAWISATHSQDVRYIVRRGDEQIDDGTFRTAVGVNRLRIKDRSPRAGHIRYSLEVLAPDDRVPENDRGRATVMVQGDDAVLLVSADLRDGNLSRVLSASGFRIDKKEPGRDLTLDDLVSYRALVFENIPALDIGSDGLKHVKRFVEEAGGGFLLTGGRRSFGLGGYRRSVFEEVLPVHLESRRERRKLSTAIVYVLDRSGSMAAPAGNGTKMDLANAGTVAGIELMSDLDEVSVIAVDSVPHVVQELSRRGDADDVIDNVLAIESGGGGIYTYSALQAAGRELIDSQASTRHIMLFADAADAEEPGEYVALLEKFSAAGIGVSVIAIGTESDADAAFLKDVALRGGGQIHFTTEAEELPQLFSFETISIMKSAFVAEPTPTRETPDWPAFSTTLLKTTPELGGYNLTQAKEGALVPLMSADQNAAPVLAFWNRGLGRSAVFTGEADGKFSGELLTWPEYSSFFATLTGWLVGERRSDALAAEAIRDGHRVSVVLDVDPEDMEAAPARPPVMLAIPNADDRPVIRQTMVQESSHRWSAVYRLQSDDTYHHRIEVAGRIVDANPVTLPYSPEFETRAGLKPGLALLRDIATRSGGEERIQTGGAFDLPAAARRFKSLAVPAAIVWLLLILGEIAVRRLNLNLRFFDQWSLTRSKRQRTTTHPKNTPVAAASTPANPGLSLPKDENSAAEATRLNRLHGESLEETLSKAKKRSRR